MNNGKRYNREETWGHLYGEHGEEKTGQDDFRSFREQFEERGMRGFNKGEKEAQQYRDKTHESGKTRRYSQDPQAKLDLHGMTLAEAKPKLDSFVRESRQLGYKFVIVIPGIGRNSLNGVAKLRPMVVTELAKMIDEHLIVNYKSAEPKHGGFGALYVYLK